MALPPDLTELADTYPLPSNATFKAGITKFLNYAKGLLGATGNAAEARNALGIGPLITYRNKIVNGAGPVNQRPYISGTATTAANQVTLDRWRVVTSGQSLVFGAAGPNRVITFPAGGAEQVIEAGAIKGGVYTLSWLGTATATVNGAAITNGGQTASLPANTAVTIRLTGGTGTEIQFERGGVVTPFEERDPAVELLLCQRDYAKSYAIATGAGAGTSVGRFTASGNVGGSIQVKVTLPVPMRSLPAILLADSNGNANSAITFSAAGAQSTRAAATQNASESSFEIFTGSAGSDVLMVGHWTASTGF